MPFCNVYRDDRCRFKLGQLAVGRAVWSVCVLCWEFLFSWHFMHWYFKLHGHFFSFCCCIIIIVPFLRFMFMWYLKAHSSSKCALCYYFFKSSWNCGNAAIVSVIRIIIVQFSRLLAPKNMETLRQKAATSNNACHIRTWLIFIRFWTDP